MTSINLNKYEGLWYEIAKYPFKWEVNCKNVTANYKNTGSKLLIKNSCIIDNETIIRSGEGVAIDKFTFKIIFNDDLPSDGIGKYDIMYTDYINYSIVTSGKDHLWILCRRKQVTEEEYNLLLQIIKRVGYDTNKLVLNELD